MRKDGRRRRLLRARYCAAPGIAARLYDLGWQAPGGEAVGCVHQRPGPPLRQVGHEQFRCARGPGRGPAVAGSARRSLAWHAAGILADGLRAPSHRFRPEDLPVPLRGQDPSTRGGLRQGHVLRQRRGPLPPQDWTNWSSSAPALTHPIPPAAGHARQLLRGRCPEDAGGQALHAGQGRNRRT